MVAWHHNTLLLEVSRSACCMLYEKQPVAATTLPQSGKLLYAAVAAAQHVAFVMNLVLDLPHRALADRPTLGGSPAGTQGQRHIHCGASQLGGPGA